MCHETADPGDILSFSSAVRQSSKMPMGLMKRCQCYSIKSTRRKSLFFVGQVIHGTLPVPVRILWENHNPVMEWISSSQSPAGYRWLLPTEPVALCSLCWSVTFTAQALAAFLLGLAEMVQHRQMSCSGLSHVLGSDYSIYHYTEMCNGSYWNGWVALSCGNYHVVTAIFHLIFLVLLAFLLLLKWWVWGEN